MTFIDDLRRNLAALQALLHEWVIRVIEENRPMWLDDGTEVGRGSVINYSGTVTKVGDQINLSGGATAAAHDIAGASHTTTEDTAGKVLQITGTDAFGWGVITEGMLPSTVALDSEVATEISTAVAAHEGTSDPHTQYLENGLYIAKGDVVAGSATLAVPGRVALGTDGTSLMADSTQTYGVKWGTPRFITYISFGSNPQIVPV